MPNLLAHSMPRTPREVCVKHRVLIVDDEALLVRTLSQAFEDAGYDVSTAKTAEDARSILESESSFDLLLLDIRLPKQSGLELLEVMGKPAGTRVVLMTAYDTDETYEQSLALGTDLYLKKPFDLQALLDKAGELVCKGAKARA